MIIDGRLLSDDIRMQVAERVKRLSFKPKVALLVTDSSSVTNQYVQKKVAFGETVGVEVEVAQFGEKVTCEELADAVSVYGEHSGVHGVVVQLPILKGCDTDLILSRIPKKKDIDALSGSSLVLPPVVGAIAYIAQKHSIYFTGKRVAVVGGGRLVGKPASLWASAQGSKVTMYKKGEVTSDSFRDADIIISGAGSPYLITPDMVSEGIVMFDAGASEQGGVVKGDCDPACAEKASLFTPVPGGIGPITIALLFNNLLNLVESVEKK
ncbi:MAG: bifunctional 5,10-methylenetetrahydrofolate dehydrogenase/5,10-methenyltetrahydrofolate cyclohydrolase [Candidatus Paceibacterota bacterium]